MKNSKFGKIIINLIALILIGITSIGMIISYKEIDNRASKKDENYFQSYDFTSVLTGISYNCLYDIAKKSSDKDITPYDVLIKSDISNDKDEYSKKNFNSRFESYIQRYLNIDYFGVNVKDKVVTSNISDEIKVLENGDIDIASINKDKYQFYLVINYDSLGNFKIKDVYGADKNLIQGQIYNNSYSLFGEGRNDLVKIQSTNFFFAVPKELNYYDNIARGIDSLQNQTYGETAFVFALIVIAFIMISALLIPYNKAKEILGFNVISKIKFEIGCIMGGLTVGLTLAVSMFMVKECIKGVPLNFIGAFFKNVTLKHSTYYMINFIVWLIIFSLYFYAALVIKHIFKVGFKNYFIDSTIIGGCIAFAFRYTKKTIKELSEVDLSDKNNKLILKIVGINAIILSFICLIWFFGIIGVLIYSVVIFLLKRI